MGTIHRSFAFVVFALGAVAVGCGGSGGGADGGSAVDALSPPDVATEAAGPLSPFCAASPAPGIPTDLSGIWAIRMVGSQIVQAPVVGLLHIKSTFTLLARVSQSGSQVTFDGHYCDRGEEDPPNATQVTIPDAWAHTEKPIHRTGTYAVAASGAPVLSIPSDEAAGGVEVAGAVLASPASDPLPASADDPRVIDEDHDGIPGITVQLNGLAIHGTLFSVQRQSTAVTASPVNGSRLSGTMVFLSTQNVLGSVPSGIADLYKMAVTSPDPDVTHSTFAMVKIADAPASSVDGGEIDGGGAANADASAAMPSCAEIRAAEACLFPEAP